MDGGYRSMMSRKIENNSPDLDDYGKPLPPPPAGYYWSRLEDGSWEILEFARKHTTDDFITVENPSVLEHVVLPSDTLQGLSLRYGVSVVSLRQINNFSGNAFRSNKTLRIPLEKGATIRVQENTKDVILQKFKNSTSESDIESKFYLEEHNWNLQDALADWAGDESWFKEKELMATKSSTAVSAPVETSVSSQHNMTEEVDENSESTPLLTPLLEVQKGVKVVEPIEIVYACASTST